MHGVSQDEDDVVFDGVEEEKASEEEKVADQEETAANVQPTQPEAL
jgi:hypothetical protein